MKVVWIGAGNLATQLGVALARAGHETLQVFSRTEASASALATRLHCAATNRVEDILTGADVYVFSVKDSVLEELVARIAPRVGEAICLHTAGSMPLDVFRGYAARYGVCYPMQSFSRTVDVDFREIPCFVEASDEASLAQVRQLAESVSGRVMEMSTAKRRYLHLAAVFACNFANHCYALSAEVLARRQSALLALARKGAVLISPCISPGEKQIARAAMEEGLPLVVLLENGFPVHGIPVGDGV